MSALLQIKDLHAAVGEKEILKGINLTIKPGEVHAIMGPNGSGKTTLANILSRKPGYAVTNGSVSYLSKNLLELEAEECAKQGLFLSFQYPVSIPGVSNIQFLKSAVNAKRQYNNLPLLDAMDFLTTVRDQMAALGIPESLLYRDINDGFSGGEKKRNEILQMSLLEPNLVILDETDSGLDIDALKAVADGINKLRDEKRSFLIITHYQRLLDYITPDFVHVLANGKVIKSGDKQLAFDLEAKGYQWLLQDQK